MKSYQVHSRKSCQETEDAIVKSSSSLLFSFSFPSSTRRVSSRFASLPFLNTFASFLLFFEINICCSRKSRYEVNSIFILSTIGYLSTLPNTLTPPPIPPIHPTPMLSCILHQRVPAEQGGFVVDLFFCQTKT